MNTPSRTRPPVGPRQVVPTHCVSNLALCQAVGMREDGRSLRIFRGWRHARFSSTLVAPWLAHLGVHRPRWRAHSLPSSYVGPALLLFLWLYRSSLPTCVSVRSPALYCIVFTAVLLTCVCVLNTKDPNSEPTLFFHLARGVGQGGRRTISERGFTRSD